MQELTNTIAAALDRITKSDTIEKAIEAQLTETIKREVKDQLSSYSEFGKQLESTIKSALQVDFSELGLPGYNDMILKIIRAQVDANVNSMLAKQIEERMTELLEPPPAEIKLSELVEQFIEFSKPDGYSCSCDDPTDITLIIEESQYGSRWIYLDKEGGKEKYECDIRFLVPERDGQMAALRIDDKDLGKTLFVGSLYKFERTLFQLYAAGTKVIVDGDEHTINTYYPDRND